MQTTTQPQAPAAPSQTPAPKPTITIPGPDGGTRTLLVPATREEVEQLIQQREELGDQLSNVASRRSSLSEQVRTAPEGQSKTGLEGRIRVLDERILQLETDLAATGRQLAMAPSGLVSLAEIDQGGGGGGDEFEEGILAGSFFTLWLVPIAVLYMRRRWKKKLAASPARVQPDSNPRMERLEQGMEAIAIEIERISEGQRFLTKLLAEAPASPAAIERGK